MTEGELLCEAESQDHKMRITLYVYVSEERVWEEVGYFSSREQALNYITLFEEITGKKEQWSL